MGGSEEFLFNDRKGFAQGFQVFRSGIRVGCGAAICIVGGRGHQNTMNPVFLDLHSIVDTINKWRGGVIPRRAKLANESLREARRTLLVENSAPSAKQSLA